MTPANIIGMAKLKELQVIAITDHNSCRNCGPAMELGDEAGILVIPGMELTTEEEVHVVCLFATLSDALSFDKYVYERLQKIDNHPTIFGNQLVVDKGEQLLEVEPYLLINATTIPFSEVYELMKQYHGIMIPAHIDKNSNSLLYNLGFIPEDSKFTCVEMKNAEMKSTLLKENPYLNECRIISNSDAHSLWVLNESVNRIRVNEITRSNILAALTIHLT